MARKILITNDDGYDSPGLIALVEALRPLAHVTVVAPALEKSASGHSLTLTRPLHFIEVADGYYKLDDGTPTDCIFLGLNKFYDAEHRPDLVISGINRGANMGEDITYSGTAAGAMEAVLQGIPAIAISQVCRDTCQDIETIGYALAQGTIVALVRKIFDGGFPLPDRQFLNINVPPIPFTRARGTRITRAGRRAYANNAEIHHNPRGIEYHWIGLPRLDWLKSEGDVMTDFEAVETDHVSITPVKLDMTAHESLLSLEEWL